MSSAVIVVHFVAAGIVVLAIIAVLVFFVGKSAKAKKLSPLAGLAFAFVIAGIVFGEGRLIGYGLMVAGVVLAVVDIVMQSGVRKHSDSTPTITQ